MSPVDREYVSASALMKIIKRKEQTKRYREKLRARISAGDKSAQDIMKRKKLLDAARYRKKKDMKLWGLLCDNQQGAATNVDEMQQRIADLERRLRNVENHCGIAAAEIHEGKVNMNDMRNDITALQNDVRSILSNFAVLQHK